MVAVSSGGGHWIELLRLLPAFDDQDVCFVTVNPDYRHTVRDHRFYVVTDATRWNKLALLRLMFQIVRILLRERPHVILSTGAAPGCLTVRIGRILGAKTIWVDSIANIGCVSLSGRLVSGACDLWLTQWPELARPEGPEYHGQVL